MSGKITRKDIPAYAGAAAAQKMHGLADRTFIGANSAISFGIRMPVVSVILQPQLSSNLADHTIIDVHLNWKSKWQKFLKNLC